MKPSKNALLVASNMLHDALETDADRSEEEGYYTEAEHDAAFAVLEWLRRLAHEE